MHVEALQKLLSMVLDRLLKLLSMVLGKLLCRQLSGFVWKDA